METDMIYSLERTALTIKENLLRLCAAHNIHIGGDLSVADVMTVLWKYQINYNPQDPHVETRDRFVLSKGHASAVLSFVQAEIGCFSPDDIFHEYATDGGRFSMHSCNLVNPYIEVSTGSLGHGMPVACGLAAGLRLKGNTASRVYTVMGDGEQSEGSVWEAAMNAAHYKLGNLVAIVDCNQLCADGKVNDLTGQMNLAEKYAAFGWNVQEFDGHNIAEIKRNFDLLPEPTSDKPTVLISHTLKGKGVAFMEGNENWHSGQISEEQCKECIGILEDAFRKKWSEML